MITRTIIGIFVFIAVWCMSLQWDREAQTTDHAPVIYEASSVLPHIGISEAEARKGKGRGGYYRGGGRGKGYSAGSRSGKSWVRKATRNRINKSVRRKELRQYKKSSIARNGVAYWKKAGIGRNRIDKNTPPRNAHMPAQAPKPRLTSNTPALQQANAAKPNADVPKSTPSNQRSSGAQSAAASAKKKDQEAGTNAHGRQRHGSHVTDAQLQNRLRNGIAPDGRFSPTPKSTRFRAGEYERTLAKAKQDYEAKTGRNFDDPPKAGERPDRKLETYHPHPVGDGFMGRAGSEIKITGQNGQIRDGYTQFDPMNNLQKTESRFEWNPSSNKWDEISHFPTN